MIRAIIIEDEPLAQRELKRLIDESDVAVTIVAVADSVVSAIDAIQSNPADLIFMDIQLSDSLSFDIFEEIEIQTPIIFTTAFDEYALRAFKVNSVDYLLKPIDPSELNRALQKYAQRQNQPVNFAALMEAFAPKTVEYKERWAVKVGDRIKRFTSQDIAYFYADDDALYLVPNHGSAVIIDGTLGELIKLVNPVQFFQISRKFIVSYAGIEKVEKYGTTQYALTLNPAYHETVTVSRNRTKDFLQWLDQ